MTSVCTAAANYIINQVNEYNLGKSLRDQMLFHLYIESLCNIKMVKCALILEKSTIQ